MSEDIYKVIFSENLKYYMEKYEKTQSDLVNDLGFDKSAVSTWVQGTRLPRMDKVNALAEYFHCLRSDLIERKDHRPAAPPQFSDGELEHMRKYRYLDEYGRSFVDDVLNREYDRCASERGNLSNLSDMVG